MPTVVCTFCGRRILTPLPVAAMSSTRNGDAVTVSETSPSTPKRLLHHHAAPAPASPRVAVVERVGRAAHDVEAEGAAVQVEDERDDEGGDADVAGVDGRAGAAGAALDAQRRVGPGRADADAEPAAEVALDVGVDAGAGGGGEARGDRGRPLFGADGGSPLDEAAEDEGAGADADAPVLSVGGGDDEEERGEVDVECRCEV